MPAPPITNPMPRTCAHCGAGLTWRTEVCPHCGTRTEMKQGKSAGWIIGTLALGICALAFGGLGACAAWVGGEVLFAGSGDYLGPLLLSISGPLLLIGGVGAWLCGRAVVRRLRE